MDNSQNPISDPDPSMPNAPKTVNPILDTRMSFAAMSAAMPIQEQLRSVPYEHRHWFSDDPTSHDHIPVGRVCHEAATLIEAQAAQIKDLSEAIGKVKDYFSTPTDHLYHVMFAAIYPDKTNQSLPDDHHDE